ncbi:MAG: aminotransferase class I/II-fold pyridoxal phosphate-dependent enzyme, partial [Erysipelotrichia bacterium]|nr:aminotransferase class I/II-fold pyridoxal phosphate-dependent enzyme [Erysipelotrichia bacterium]
VREYANLYVTRTLSKAYASAGLRVGFLAGQKDAMQRMKAAKVPYALSTLAMKAACIVLNHAEEFQKAASETVRRRERMLNQVRNMKRTVFYPSSANFLYGRSSDREELLNRFQSAGIAIRSYHDDSFRITIGTEEELQAVLSVLNAFETEAG